MKTIQEQRVSELFEATVDLSLEDQAAALIDLKTTEEPAVLEELRSLLEADGRQGDFLDGLELTPVDRTDSHAGPYRLEHKLGEGGMSEVFLGVREDGELARQVAVKLVRQELLSPVMIRRFEMERQILASLEHPSIATLLDAGRTASGRPYFVMELLEGESIDRFCDQRQLTLRARVELFQEVCSAVHFAHQNLVVHRDIKPSNILVTADGAPKLLDFGIAKLLNPDLLPCETELTRRWERLMTPQYASPEQRAGRPVSTATDVYSLGAVLYKLLTGTLPHGAVHGLERKSSLEDSEPPSSKFRRARSRAPNDCPSDDGPNDDPQSRAALRSGTSKSLARELSGDLDAIILRALRPEEGSRYASAQQLGEDLGRFLRAEPVLAHRGGWRYRMGRLLRRQRLAASLVASIAALVILATALFAVQSIKLRVERNRARLERDRAQEVTAFLNRLFEQGNPGLGGSHDITVRQVLDTASTRIEEDLPGQSERQADLRTTLARAYFGMGLPKVARPLLEQALESRRQIYGPKSLEVAKDLRLLGIMYRRLGDTTASEAAQQQALAIFQQAEGDHSLDVARCHAQLGLLYRDPERSIEFFQLALEVFREHPKASEEDLIRGIEALGIGYHRGGKFEKARPLFEEAVAMRQENGSHPLALSSSKALLAASLSDLGEYEEAERIFLEHDRIETEALGPRNFQRPGRLNNLGTVVSRQGREVAAEKYFREGLELAREMRMEDRPDYHALLSNLGVTLLALDRPAEAEPLFRETLRLRRGFLPEGHWKLVRQEIWLGSSLVALGRFEEAERLLEPWLSTLRSQPDLHLHNLHRALEGLIQIAEARERTGVARSYREELAALPAPPP
ncbi:MAG: serine/threonine-protein kinase [Deltaproteobacteria bacterium]|nr:serine/threonine-protein kinase [Deltaproteobacteria bacterium]